MTDSGQGPLVGFPVWLGFQLSGVGLTAMRFPVICIAAAVIPLLWIVGRRLVGPRAALLAALLLAVSPVWLLYGRTATLVGISLVPALLTVYVLLGTLDSKRGWLQNVIFLQLLLIIGAYAYAPIRFLWPMSLGLMLMQLARRRDRPRILTALAITACMLPLALTMIGSQTTPGMPVIDRLKGYYNARGEQLLALNKNPDNYSYYIEVDPSEQETLTRSELAVLLVQRNAGDLARLLLDWDTAPALTHYYNPRGQPVGRLYPVAVAPFLVIGLVVSVRRLILEKRYESLVLLVMAAGFTLPMLLTSRVHIGRLIYALPFLLLLTGIGAVAAGRLFETCINRLATSNRSSLILARFAAASIPILLLGAMAWSAIEEEHVDVPVPRSARVEAVLRSAAVGTAIRGGALITGDHPAIEVVSVAGYRLGLDERFTFIDIREPTVRPLTSISGEHPPLYYGNLLNQSRFAKLPERCSLVYFVEPAVEDQFVQALEAMGDNCPSPSQYVLLPT